ncbi:MAG: hypothetical protein B6D68_02905, partial [spirochete symbiont of Stewartia floridana]
QKEPWAISRRYRDTHKRGPRIYKKLAESPQCMQAQHNRRHWKTAPLRRSGIPARLHGHNPAAVIFPRVAVKSRHLRGFRLHQNHFLQRHIFLVTAIPFSDRLSPPADAGHPNTMSAIADNAPAVFQFYFFIQ